MARQHQILQEVAERIRADYKAKLAEQNRKTDREVASEVGVTYMTLITFDLHPDKHMATFDTLAKIARWIGNGIKHYITD